MLKKFLKEVVSIVVGKQAEDIVDLLDGKKYINEFLIAKKLDITVNQARNILYKLSDYNLVSSIRKKDKRKGWYTYFWKMEILKSLEFLKSVYSKKIDQINHQVRSRETKQFYVCERCNIEFNEENALLHNFTCNECGGIFTIKDNTKVLREFRKNLDKFEKELELIDVEINKEKGKLEKEKLKVLKKEAKERAKKRKARRKTKKKDKKKTAKKKFAKKKTKKAAKKKSKKKATKKKTKTKISKKKPMKKKTPSKKKFIKKLKRKPSKEVKKSSKKIKKSK